MNVSIVLCVGSLWPLLYVVCLGEASIVSDKKPTACTPSCVHGQCRNGTCVCDVGWTGNACTSCHSRIRLTSSSGFVSDGGGNYSENMRCAWLLDASHIPKAKISLKLDHFATECAWDHVFLYDGDGVFSNQMAALSGVLTPSPHLSELEFVAGSGQGFVYFYSDLAYNMTGFNISYSVSACPFDCNKNGKCDAETGKCKCNDKWDGDACNIKSCLSYCENGKCEDNVCECYGGYAGPHCNITMQNAVWNSINPSIALGGRASHTSAILDDQMWIYAGLGFTSSNIKQFARFDFGAEKWTVINTGDSEPPPRYDHSLAAYQDSLYVFGGVINDEKDITNEFWKYDSVGETWLAINVNSSWLIPRTQGVRVHGTYGHSSVYDPQSASIYVYGGYYAHPGSAMGSVSDRLYKYIPLLRKWEILRCSGRQTFLHAAAISDGVMIVTGGNAHNESLPNKATECYSEAIMAYDIECDEWYTMDAADYLLVGTNRYGHTMTQHKTNLYIYGGFNGRMLEAMVKFTPGDCSQLATERECLASKQGVKCRWAKKSCSTRDEAKSLVANNYKEESNYNQAVCSSPGTNNYCSSDCSEFLDCKSCTSSSTGCIWCLDRCDNSCQSKTILKVSSPSECASSGRMCRLEQTCTACSEKEQCVWESKTNGQSTCSNRETTQEDGPFDESEKVDRSTTEQESILGMNDEDNLDLDVCQQPCSFHTNCTSCGSHGCMWCSTLNRCIDINSYLPCFPYGQCTQWKSPQSPCYQPDTCESQLTCKDCQDLSPRCGWCDDGSGTGLGKCMNGGYSGPVTKLQTGQYEADLTKCDQQMWYFFDCPACQCNGHGYCSNSTDVTSSLASNELSCQHCDEHTVGEHCDTCHKGFYGNALNGGNCTECMCNGQAQDCDSLSGDCYCTTKGVSGKYCDKCEQKYIGDPKNQTCFYELSVDFIFTFSLKLDVSEPKDKYVTQINFVTRPPKEDTDVTFKLTCSGSPTAKVNLTVYSTVFDLPKRQRRFLANTPCSEIERTFTSKDFKFGPSANTTFFVYLYDFKVPVIIQISFAQTPPIDWIRFFATFACCFIFLLVLAGVFWKVKLRVDLYRRRQRMFVEMAQMASRPFGCAQLELPDHKSFKHTQPTPLCIEPLRDYKAAVVTVAVKLPTGGLPHAPSGQTGLAVGSALCWLTPAQINLLQTPSPGDEQEQANKGNPHSRLGPRLANMILPFR